VNPQEINNIVILINTLNMFGVEYTVKIQNNGALPSFVFQKYVDSKEFLVFTSQHNYTIIIIDHCINSRGQVNCNNPKEVAIQLGAKVVEFRKDHYACILVKGNERCKMNKPVKEVPLEYENVWLW
jgi:hypothetical protein